MDVSQSIQDLPRETRVTILYKATRIHSRPIQHSWPHQMYRGTRGLWRVVRAGLPWWHIPACPTFSGARKIHILFHCEHRHIDFLATDPRVCEDTSFWIGHTKKKRCKGSKLQALFFSRLILAMPGFWEFLAYLLLASSSSKLHKWNKHCNDDHQQHENKTKLNAQIDFQNI